MQKTSWTKLITIWFAFIIVVLGANALFPKSWNFSTRLIVQELIAIAVILTLNYFWIHQPLHFKSDVPAKTILMVNSLTIIVCLQAILVWTQTKNANVETALIIGVCAGVTEELLFRGILLPGTLSHFSGHAGMWRTVLIVSVLFGATHMVNLGAHQVIEATLVQGLNAFFLGLFLAALYLRTRSLIWPMLFHGINDFEASLGVSGSIIYTHGLAILPLLGPWILMLAVSIFLLRKSKTQRVYEVVE
ncbi:CPBP family intramembrane glutamic endopeptidase [Levilactobacillus bambusae]|nr:CPBP family intramembrane glutamic endopeptidase [Levilactobacillus bambusae]